MDGATWRDCIGLSLILGVLSYTASFFGVFIMLNYILADIILHTQFNCFSL